MVIDIHSHLAYAPIYPDKYLSDMFMDMDEAQRKKLDKLMSVLLRDADGSYFLKQMDKAGIERTVLLIIDGGIGLGEPAMSLEEIYRLHARIVSQWPDRYVIFGGADPRRGAEGFDLFKKGVEVWGFRGLKLYPPMGYAMDDEGLFPYYEYCDRYGLPVLLHTGPSQKNLRNELADPLFITPVARRFNRIPFILAHAGFSLTPGIIQLAESLNNVFIDIAGFRAKYKKVDDQMVDDMRPLFTEGLNKKVLFGNDWPLFNLLVPVSNNVDMMRQVDASIRQKPDGALENILYNNAKALLV